MKKARSDDEAPRATITLERRQWQEILRGWEFYETAVPYDRRDERWAGLMPVIHREIGRRLATCHGDTVPIDFRWSSWWIVAIWAASVTCLTACRAMSLVMADVVPQIVAQEPKRGSESERD